MMPTVMQARRVRVSPAVAGSRRVRVAAVSMMAREGRVRVPVPLVTLSLCVIGVCGLMDAHRVIRRIRAIK